MRRNRARGGSGWVRRVTVRPQVRVGRFEGIEDTAILVGQSRVIQEHRRKRAVTPRRIDPVAEALRG